ncbi:MAG: tRNA uridine(34) 5-carboxymethylaminomethyl modification radical SAM/GNAT enzyme Elp3 [Candidatus Thermoplasmatota archaeon]|nr:tRNA uridine(34) 5-carboxymethylaminomethyl modification radical SAM/GNAT enzyme Elp3 [Candidatus Thermoplasmatota archaeon]
MSFYDDVIQSILSKKISSKQEVHRLKIKICKHYGFNHIPPNSEILSHIPTWLSEEEKLFVIKALRKKPMRTISGVAVVAVMTSPEKCPHGQCVPCPGGPREKSPQSYTGFEPAAMRGALNNFDPFQQVSSRINQLESIGHITNKIELIIMGGTFTSRSFWYQEWFVRRCYEAMNQKKAVTLEQAKKDNETSKHRCIGMTIETRPDWFRLQQIDQTLSFGATRVELGVQHVFDNILYAMKRGHTVSDTIFATRAAKEAGFKVCYHFMPGLSGSDEKMDLDAVKEFFSNPLFQPDMLKIYPTLVIKNTPLYDQWKKGLYEPLTTKESVSRIAQIVSIVPEYVRIQRIQRDVPAQNIEAGVKKSNLRQLVDKKIVENNLSCNEIRFKEVGHWLLQGQKESKTISIDTVNLQSIKYEASGGTELFLSLVHPSEKVLLGYLRLRDLACPHRYELQNHPCMIIRELKILGQEIGIGTIKSDGVQHQGFGKQLVNEAQRICLEEFDKRYLFVLSGVGVKEYYRKYLDFSDFGYYLFKEVF